MFSGNDDDDGVDDKILLISASQHAKARQPMQMAFANEKEKRKITNSIEITEIVFHWLYGSGERDGWLSNKHRRTQEKQIQKENGIRIHSQFTWKEIDIGQRV